MIEATADVGPAVPPGVLIGSWRVEQAGQVLGEQILKAIPPITPAPNLLDRLDAQYKVNLARWLLGEAPSRDVLDEAVQAAATTVAGGGFIGPMQIGTRQENLGGPGPGAGAGGFGVASRFGQAIEYGKLIDSGFTARALETLWDYGITLVDLLTQTLRKRVENIDLVLHRGGLAPGERTALLQSRAAIRRSAAHGFRDLV